MKNIILGFAAAAAIAAPASAAVQNIWSTSFDSSEYETTGPFTFSFLSTSFGGANFEASGTIPGSGTQVFRNTTAGTTTFTANGLGAHSALQLSFDITFVDSWDSDNGVPGVSPDWLFVNIDGLGLQQFTVASASGSNYIVGSATLLSGGSNTIGSGYNDYTYRFSYVIPHVSANWSMSINAGGAGFQYGDDESWAIDNFALGAVVRDTGGVPEPATWAMMIAGFGLVGAAARRRRVATATA